MVKSVFGLYHGTISDFMHEEHPFIRAFQGHCWGELGINKPSFIQNTQHFTGIHLVTVWYWEKRERETALVIRQPQELSVPDNACDFRPTGLHECASQRPTVQSSFIHSAVPVLKVISFDMPANLCTKCCCPWICASFTLPCEYYFW